MARGLERGCEDGQGAQTVWEQCPLALSLTALSPGGPCLREEDRLTGAQTGGSNPRPLSGGQRAPDVVPAPSACPGVTPPQPPPALLWRLQQKRQAPCRPSSPSPRASAWSPRAPLPFLPFRCEVLLSREPLHLPLPDRQGQGRRGTALGGPSSWMGREACRGAGAVADEWLSALAAGGEQLPAGSAPGSQGAGAEICLYLCSGSGGTVRREMAEQRGAKATPGPEQSAGWQKQVSCFPLPTRYCPFGTRARMYTLSENTG